MRGGGGSQWGSKQDSYLGLRVQAWRISRQRLGWVGVGASACRVVVRGVCQGVGVRYTLACMYLDEASANLHACSSLIQIQPDILLSTHLRSIPTRLPVPHFPPRSLPRLSRPPCPTLPTSLPAPPLPPPCPTHTSQDAGGSEHHPNAAWPACFHPAIFEFPHPHSPPSPLPPHQDA